MTSIFVEADEPLLLFPSIEMAERYLEVEDVRNGVYPRAFDSGGELFSIGVDGERVLIRATGSADLSGLRQLLTSWLESIGDPPSDDTTVSEMVASVEAFWAQRDPFGDRFGTAIPWWGCLLLIGTLAGVVALTWLIIRVI